MPSKCAVCDSLASNLCGGCGEIYYCTREHQKIHWPIHIHLCKPYRIVTNETLGRYMIATRNLNAGDLIFREKPLIAGPKQDTRPVCLTCFANVDEKSCRCPSCLFPFCSLQCAKNPNHTRECAVLSRAKNRIKIDNFENSHPVYECITPLRGMLLKKSQPKEYEMLMSLQNHNEARKKMEFWQVNQINTVNFLRKTCQMGNDFHDEEIHSICGVLDVNAFEIKMYRTRNFIRGLFPIAAMMAHRCISNIYHVIEETDCEMVVRAAVPIKKGETIFSSYTPSLDGTLERRKILRESKFFDCDCLRCSDPTECGTYLSALKCQKCSIGNVLPLNPLNDSSDWRCDRCSYNLTVINVMKVIHKLKEEFHHIQAHEIDKYEQFMKRHRKLLHPNHYIFTDICHSLSQLYGRNQRYLINNLSDDLLERKAELCQRLLAITDKVEPGLSRLRGVTLYELHAPLLMLARRRFDSRKISREEFKHEIAHVASLMEECCKILSMENKSSTEGQMGQAAKDALQALRQLYEEI